VADLWPGRTLRLPASSTEDIWLPVAGEHPTLGVLAVSSQWTAQAAIISDNGLAPTSWLSATWETTTRDFAGIDGVTRTYSFARLRVGPGTGGQVTLTGPAFYRCWLKLTEISTGIAAVIPHGQIEATP